MERIASWKRTLTRSALVSLGFVLAIVAAWIFAPHQTVDLETQIGHGLPWLTVLPFGLILLSIALLPLALPHWWESNGRKALVSAIFSLPILAYFLVVVPEGASALILLGEEFISFLAILIALFTITGGIYVEGDIAATPRANTTILAVGGVLTNLIGTTGASMLLLRPVLRVNQQRRNKSHIVIFFIFIVSNLGGSLTPLGDPPLFMGFLRGVPFTWTLSLWREWLLAVVLCLVVFYIWERRAYAREAAADLFRDAREQSPIRLRGAHNLLFLLAVILGIIFLTGTTEIGGLRLNLGALRDPLLLLLALASYLIDRYNDTHHATPGFQTARLRNGFTFGAVNEVGILFAGIFVTMLPAICLLKAHGAEFGVSEPWQFFWLSGALSSFLDNAPTYVTFSSLGQGLNQCGASCLANQAASWGAGCIACVPPAILGAVSCGAVFMGANTYIGNAPNFMVKTLAEEYGVKMPSFFGYMLYSMAVLLPVFVIETLVFFI